MQVLFIFESFRPDDSEYGNALLVATNALPIYRTYRPLEQLSARAQVASPSPILAAHCHVWPASSPKQRFVPLSVHTQGTWYGDHTKIDEEEFDDAEYVTSNGADSFRVNLILGENPPASDHVLYMRYRIYGLEAGDSWTLDCELIRSTSTVVAKIAESGTGAKGWTLANYSLSAGEMATLVAADYTTNGLNLNLKPVLTISGGQKPQTLDPDADIDTGDWEDENGVTAGLSAKIADSDDNTYAVSKVLARGESDTYWFSLDSTAGDPFDELESFSLNVRHYATNAGVNVKIVVGGYIDGEPSEETSSRFHVSYVHFNVTDIGAPADLAAAHSNTIRDKLKSALAELKDDGGVFPYLTLYVKVIARYPKKTASTVWATSKPATDVQNDGWTTFGAGASVSARLSDASDSTGITSPAGGGNTDVYVDLGAYDIDVETGAERQLVVRTRNDDGTKARSVQIDIIESGASVATKTFSLAAGEALTDKTWNLQGTDAVAVKDFTNMRVRIRAVSASGTGTVSVAEVKLQLAAARRLVVTKADLDLGSHKYAAVSWAQLRTPAASTGSTTGDFDRKTIFAARNKRIFTVDAVDGIVDVSKSGADYTNGNRSWDFCSWGEFTIATNYVDAVQKMDPEAATEFSDLITGSTKPKARFCCIGRDQLFLGDINLAGHYSDEVMSSQINNAASFDGEDAIVQRLRRTPGQITGMVGGDEYILIFKRTSIYRGSWVGSPAYWRFDVVSRNIGTDKPQSIIALDQMVFFYGQGAGRGWYSIIGGNDVLPIDEWTRQHYSDAYFSEKAIKNVWSNNPRELESVVLGDLDPATGLCMWFYRDEDGTAFRNTLGAVYNPAQKRFADLDIGDSPANGGISAVCSVPNITHDARRTLLGLAIFQHDGTNITYSTFSGDTTYDLTLETGILPFDVENGRSGVIRGVRPYFKGTRGFDGSPQTLWHIRSFQVTVTISDDQLQEKNARTVVAYGNEAQKDGWVPIDLKGKFGKAKLVVKSLGLMTLKEIVGVEFDFDPGESE